MADWMPRPPRFFHYRDRDQTEVDIVVESSNRIWGIEIKTAASATSKDIKGLLKLASIAGERFQQGIVFYDGQATLPLHKEPSILAMPISKLWSF
jgi:predicted AAA+ superfamily ATPase